MCPDCNEINVYQLPVELVEYVIIRRSEDKIYLKIGLRVYFLHKDKNTLLFHTFRNVFVAMSSTSQSRRLSPIQFTPPDATQLVRRVGRCELAITYRRSVVRVLMDVAAASSTSTGVPDELKGGYEG